MMGPPGGLQIVHRVSTLTVVVTNVMLKIAKCSTIYTQGYQMNRDEMYEMMCEPADWLHWPMLPLVNRRKPGFPECAVLLTGHGPKLFMSNVFDFDMNCASVEFKSFHEILDAGWEID